MKKYFLCMIIGGALMQATSCTAQIGPLGAQPIQLEHFDFATSIKTILPHKYIEQQYGSNIFRAPSIQRSNLVKRDTSYDDRFGEDRKPQWVEYRAMSSCTADDYARYGKASFYKVNMAVALNGEIMVMNALMEAESRQDAEKVMDILNKKHGKPEKTMGEFQKPYEIYTWQLPDRIIKYCIVSDDESNTLKLEVDKEKGSISEGKRQLHYDGYLYIINKKYAAKIVGNMHTGDLLYCH